MTSTIPAETWVSAPFTDDKYNFIDKLKLLNHPDFVDNISDTNHYQHVYIIPNRYITNSCAREFPYDKWTSDMEISSQSTSVSVSCSSDDTVPYSSSEVTPESSEEMHIDDPLLYPSDEVTPESSEEIHIDNPLLAPIETLSSHKRLMLSPSCFLNGCVCGHNFDFRDMAYESRKRKPAPSGGVTIRPKIPPISAKLRNIY
jgi:hypothetical protein